MPDLGRKSTKADTDVIGDQIRAFAKRRFGKDLGALAAVDWDVKRPVKTRLERGT